jgi:hypothetical protein
MHLWAWLFPLQPYSSGLGYFLPSHASLGLAISSPAMHLWAWLFPPKPCISGLGFFLPSHASLGLAISSQAMHLWAWLFLPKPCISGLGFFLPSHASLGLAISSQAMHLWAWLFLPKPCISGLGYFLSSYASPGFSHLLPSHASLGFASHTSQQCNSEVFKSLPQPSIYVLGSLLLSNAYLRLAVVVLSIESHASLGLASLLTSHAFQGWASPVPQPRVAARGCPSPQS